jgi:hypothetical protein
VTAPQLFPKPPRRMKQPRKDTLRQTIRNREAEIERMRAELDRIPRWVRAIAQRFQALRLHSRAR